MSASLHPAVPRLIAPLVVAVLFTVLPGVARASPSLSPDSADGAVAASSDWLPVRSYAAYVDEAAQRFAIPENWIWAVMRVESRGNARAVSPVGAMGLMQLMPATWADLSARYGLGSDPFDVRANIHAGGAYLRQMWDRYGDLGAMLAAYNAGPARADAWLAGRRQLPVETIAYVAQTARAIGAKSIASPAIPSAPDPLAWRRAALFAAQSVGVSPSAEPAEPRASVRATSGDASPETAPDWLSRNPLFVVLSSSTRP